MKHYKKNDPMLLEFLQNWDKAEWKRVKKLAESGYLSVPGKGYSFRGKSIELLDLMISQIKCLSKKKELSFKIFSSVCPNKLTQKDWSKFTSELLIACYAHTKMALGKDDFEIHSSLEMQRYFQNKSMWINHDYIQEENKENVLEGKIYTSSQGVWMRMLSDLELSDIRNKEKRELFSENIQLWKEGTMLYNYENMFMIHCLELGLSNFLQIDINSIDNNYLNEVPKGVMNYTQIELYQLSYLIRRDHSSKSFFELYHKLDGLLAGKTRFDYTYFAPLYVVLLSHCVYKVQHEEEELKFRELYIEICKKMLDKKLLLEQGKMDKRHFRNIITSYIKLGDTNEAVSFIEDHHDTLMDEKDNPFLKYCFAYKHYSLKEYELAYNILYKIRKYNKTNDFIKLQIKLLFLFSALHIKKVGGIIKNEIRNSKLMIERKEGISESYIEAWENTIDFLEKIYLVPLHMVSEDYPTIIKELEQKDNIKHRDWLSDFLNKK
jgi:hypothetical protein